jgi:3-oxoadipate CoA-transferase, alpha subunit
MINKIAQSIVEAVSVVGNGSTVLIGGFGDAGLPTELIHALLDRSTRNLTVVSNNVGSGDAGLAALIRERRVRRIICSFPRVVDGGANPFEALYRAGEIELELVPQGTLAERLRAGGAGIPAFYTPTGVGSELCRDKEVRRFAGRDHVLEHAIRGDVAFIKAEVADRWGNLVYRKAARNFGPVMATAASVTIAQVRRIAVLGSLDPETIITPGIFVTSVVHIPHPENETRALAAAESGS